jgi:hypothetical protein
MTKELNKITGPQLQALLAYARDHGRDWKARLSQDWMRAGSPWSGPWAPLQQLRNQQGPFFNDTATTEIYTQLPDCNFELSVERSASGATAKLLLGIKVRSLGDPGVRYYDDGSGQPPESPELEVVWATDAERVPIATFSDDDFELTDDEYSRACDKAIDHAEDREL